MNRIAGILYRPTENHVGIIYRFGRFLRFVGPNRWTALLPWIDAFENETSLDLRMAAIRLEDVYTQDDIALDIDVRVSYAVDLRIVNAKRCNQVLRFENDVAWEDLLRTSTTDIIRNLVIAGRTFAELTGVANRIEIKHTLSQLLSARVREFGMLVNPRSGVIVMNLQPNKAFQQALKDGSAARTLGSAAADRIRPLFEQFQDQSQQQAFATLILQIAAAVAKDGKLPDILFPSNTDLAVGRGSAGPELDGSSTRLQRVTPFRPPRSLAGD